MLLASACTAALPMPTRSANADLDNYRLRHPVAVESTIATLSLPGATGEAQLSDTETSRLDSFIRGYRTRGRGKLTIIVPGSDSGQDRALARGKQVAAHAKLGGLRENEVVLRIDTAGGGSGRASISVNYESFVVHVSECGDWSKQSSYDPSNTIHSNSGCANARNAALMVANPADLASPRTAAPHDTARSSVVIQQYRVGESTLAERSASESAAIADVAE
jgi:pilus assembly protein CpaD